MKSLEPADTAARGLDGPPLRVLLVDDSVVARHAVTRLLESDPGIRVAAQAGDGEQALALIARAPADAPFDLVLLDVEMPGLDGLATLPRLIRADPLLPVVMNSALTRKGAETTLQALRLGASDWVAKPPSGALDHEDFRRELIAKVRGLGRARRARPDAARGGGPASGAQPGSARDYSNRAAAPASPNTPGGPAAERKASPPLLATPAATALPLLIAVGSSTGGPQALFAFVEGLGGGLGVPVVVAQHMPPEFTAMLGAHLDRLGVLPCREARDGEALQPSHLYVAPGNRHLLIERRDRHLHARISDAAPVNFCRPSVDMLLSSAATACQGRVLAVMLTGMGQDGLTGTRDVVAAGGNAIAQDEATSVVWGMPGAVAQAGLCRAVLPLAELGPRARRMAGDPPRPPSPLRRDKQ